MRLLVINAIQKVHLRFGTRQQRVHQFLRRSKLGVERSMSSQTHTPNDPEAQGIALEERKLGEFLVNGSLYTLHKIPDEAGATVTQFPRP